MLEILAKFKQTIESENDPKQNQMIELENDPNQSQIIEYENDPNQRLCLQNEQSNVNRENSKRSTKQTNWPKRSSPKTIKFEQPTLKS